MVTHNFGVTLENVVTTVTTRKSSENCLFSETGALLGRLTHTPRKTGGRGWTLDNVGGSFFHEKTAKKAIFRENTGNPP